MSRGAEPRKRSEPEAEQPRPSGMTGLDGKQAVVVGGASGIGAAVTSLLRARGADVVVADLRADDGVVACDVTDEASVVALFEGLDRLDIAVNCAGVSGRMGPITELELDTWRDVLDVKLTGNFLCIRE